MKELKKTVIRILEKSEKARSNDNYLVYRVYKEMGWSTDLKDIAQNGEFKFGTISRMRRMAQHSNPLLLPKKEITRKRIKRAEKFKEMARGL